MSKRPFVQVDTHQDAPPSKCRRTLLPNLPVRGARKPVVPVLQIPTPDLSPGTASASTSVSTPESSYATPKKYSLVSTVRTLGTGGQGRAVLYQDTEGRQFVVKFFKKLKYAIREAWIMRQIHASAGASPEWDVLAIEHGYTLNHPRIVGIQDGPYNNFPGHMITPDGPEWAILLDYAKGETLTHCKSEYMRQSRALPEMLVWKYFYQMAEALAFMHWGHGTSEFDPKNPCGRPYSFVHRDLKPCNVLRTSTASAASYANSVDPYAGSDPYPNIRICDFGMSGRIKKAQFGEVKTGGSEYWQPPEQCQAPHLAGPAQDVWAMGAIIHYLALGEPPCDGTNPALPLEDGADWRASLPRKATSISTKPEKRSSMFKGVKVGGLRTEFHKADVDKKWGGCYSQLLNHYMQWCLPLDASDRATSWDILREMGGVYLDIKAKCKGNPGAFARRVRNMKL